MSPFVLLGPREEGDPDDVESMTRNLASPLQFGVDQRERRIQAVRDTAQDPNPWVRAMVERILGETGAK